jgi:hypothetical protein
MARLDVLEKSSLPPPRTEFRLLGPFDQYPSHYTGNLVKNPPESDHMVDTGVVAV